MYQLTENQLAGNNVSRNSDTDGKHNGHAENHHPFIGFNIQAFKFHGHDQA